MIFFSLCSLVEIHRGEYFRHTQNKGCVPRPRVTGAHNTPTLPADLLADSAYATDKARPPRDTRAALFVCEKHAEPPASGLALTSTPRLRAGVLSVVLPAVAEQHRVPRLTLLCLQILVASSSDAEFSNAVLPFIPPHLRHDLLRWTAVHHPLNNQKLHALCGNEGHVNGELIIVGPSANVSEDQFQWSQAKSCSAEWDSDDSLPPHPMHTYVLVSAHLSFSNLSALPATLTRLALVNIPTAVSLHRLPTTCPLVECLDLSYNTWLVAEKEARERLGKIPWSRWHRLRVWGMRECCVPRDMLDEINKGRWDDVAVVQ
ncbi:hypothetical protein GGX14DRAFT_355991 [Mycena pura]|uniref:Uncharacterized protein n=1 Tax=Mycena pura TaxID=153505 RepID=A0AAD6VPV8_9AGAR|nr:hypothetical protein GGX14DRAFT_355991 [Mycena pura]